MKNKLYTAIGLMSGTSMDGIDLSLVRSDGIDQFTNILDKYYEYDANLHEQLIDLRNMITNIGDLKKYSQKLSDLEREITLFHCKIVNEVSLEYNDKINLVGFHGQTIFHNTDQQISKQLGDGELMSQLIRKNVVYDFRQEDLRNGGQGAPLTPVFHHLLSIQNQIKLPVCFLNIGGISNITIVKDKNDLSKLTSKDIGPGNCLIDSWVRKNSNKKFDKDGDLASSGFKNEIIFEQAQELYSNRNSKKKLSLDTNDFDISFIRGLSLQDGATTLTDFTASIIGEELAQSLKDSKEKIYEVLLCGGGRKNKILLKKIKEYLPLKINIKLIDDYKINGDFIESQAFAFLAVRCIEKLPISFPRTTGCVKACPGGEIITN